MKKLLSFLALLALPVSAQQVYNQFSINGAGLLYSATGNNQFTPATSSTISNLWSGTCNTSTFLRGDGSCAVAGAGTVTSVALAMPGIFTVSGAVTTSGTLTATASGTSGGIPYFPTSTTLGSTGVLPLNSLITGGGAGNPPTGLASTGTTTTVLHGNASGAPSFGPVSLTTDVSGILPTANGGTGVNSLTGIIKGAGSAAFTAAVAADVYSLWTGTCSSTTLLQGNGVCLPVNLATEVTGVLPAANGGSSTTASATFAYNALPSSLNLTTEGTMDWIIWVGVSTPPDLQSQFGVGNGVNYKKMGGFSIKKMSLSIGGSASGTFPTTSVSVSASDRYGSNTAISGSALSPMIVSSGGAYSGFQFSLPCDTFQRVARLYVSNATPYVVTLLSTDGGLNTSNTRSTGGNDQIVITYNCTYNGQSVEVNVGNDGSHTGAMTLAVVTLAPT